MRIYYSTKAKLTCVIPVALTVRLALPSLRVKAATSLDLLVGLVSSSEEPATEGIVSVEGDVIVSQAGEELRFHMTMHSVVNALPHCKKVARQCCTVCIPGILRVSSCPSP